MGEPAELCCAGSQSSPCSGFWVSGSGSGFEFPAVDPAFGCRLWLEGLNLSVAGLGVLFLFY